MQPPENCQIASPQPWLETVLHGATHRGDANAVNAWLARGENPNARARSTGETPLHLASNGTVASLLLSAGANTEARDNYGETPLHTAARGKLLDVMQSLVAAGANVNARTKTGETPLFHSSWEAHVQGALLLLTNAADPNAQNKYGQTSLHQAVRHANIEIARLLLRAGADPLLRECNGAMPIHWCVTGEIKQLLAAVMGSAATGDRPLAEPPSKRKLGLVRLVFHPVCPEAITVAEQAILTRWALQDPPRVLAGVQTTLDTFHNVRLCQGTGLFLAAASERIELRSWETLEVVAKIERPGNEGAFTAADLSPDGHWIAAVQDTGGCLLFERESGRMVSKVEFPDWSPCLRFDPTGLFLAVPGSDQGGARIKIYELRNGRLTVVTELFGLRKDDPSTMFADVPVHLAFSQDGNRLALFETEQEDEIAGKPKGWLGNVLCFETRSWEGLWRVSLDARLTGDRRPPTRAADGRVFRTEIAFVNNETLACGATRGQVLLLRCANGELVRKMAVDSKALVVALGPDCSGGLWAALGKPDGGLIRVSQNMMLDHNQTTEYG